MESNSVQPEEQQWTQIIIKDFMVLFGILRHISTRFILFEIVLIQNVPSYLRFLHQRDLMILQLRYINPFYLLDLFRIDLHTFLLTDSPCHEEVGSTAVSIEFNLYSGVQLIRDIDPSLLQHLPYRAILCTFELVPLSLGESQLTLVLDHQTLRLLSVEDDGATNRLVLMYFLSDSLCMYFE